MNRKFLLDSLDGLKGLVLRLLPEEIRRSIGCVPMTTDGPWTEQEKTIFEQVTGIPGEQTYWAPGGLVNVPVSSDRSLRSAWLDAVTAISQKSLFLDPDTGFYPRPGKKSNQILLIDELKALFD